MQKLKINATCIYSKVLVHSVRKIMLKVLTQELGHLTFICDMKPLSIEPSKPAVCTASVKSYLGVKSVLEAVISVQDRWSDFCSGSVIEALNTTHTVVLSNPWTSLALLGNTNTTVSSINQINKCWLMCSFI